MISHHGRFWSFNNLRLTPRPVQQPWPPKWVTVVSTASARKAARRGARICTGFHPQSKVLEIFDAYRDEACRVGRSAGPDGFCIRRQVILLDDDTHREEIVAERGRASRERLRADPRVDLPDRPALLDSPAVHAFAIGDEEFIAGTPRTVAEQIIHQCRQVGAGHFAANFGRKSPEELRDVYDQFGTQIIPLLRNAYI